MAKTGAGVATAAFTLPTITGLTTTYFLRLRLQLASGAAVSDNLYWYSTQTDAMNYAGSTYYYTPICRPHRPELAAH